MDLSKVLKGLKDAKTMKRGVFLDEGRYVLKVRATLMIEPNAGGTAFILESEVLETPDPTNHPVGSERTWYQSFKYKDSAFGELKKFTYAVLKLDPTNPDDKKKIEEQVDPQIEAMLSEVIENNRFAGIKIRCEVVNRDTKKTFLNKETGEEEHGVFSQYNFSPYIEPAAAKA